jgi:hypothetical protein
MDGYVRGRVDYRYRGRFQQTGRSPTLVRPFTNDYAKTSVILSGAKDLFRRATTEIPRYARNDKEFLVVFTCL